MKLVKFLFLVSSLLLSGNGYSQKITIDKNNASLEEILLDIHKQTGYSYSATNELLQKARRIDIHAKDNSLEQVLSMVVKSQPFTYLILGKVIIIKRDPKKFNLGGI